MTIKATTVVRFSAVFYLKQQTTLSCQKTYFKRKIINAIGVCPHRLQPHHYNPLVSPPQRLFRQGNELDAEIAELVVALLSKLDKGIFRKRLLRGLDLSLRTLVNGNLGVLTLRQSLAPLGPVPTGS